MEFTIMINEKSHLEGITWARERYNENKAVENQLATDADYVQFLVEAAVRSYAVQKTEVVLQEVMRPRVGRPQ